MYKEGRRHSTMVRWLEKDGEKSQRPIESQSKAGGRVHVYLLHGTVVNSSSTEKIKTPTLLRTVFLNSSPIEKTLAVGHRHVPQTQMSFNWESGAQEMTNPMITESGRQSHAHGYPPLLPLDSVKFSARRSTVLAVFSAAKQTAFAGPSPTCMSHFSIHH